MIYIYIFIKKDARTLIIQQKNIDLCKSNTIQSARSTLTTINQTQDKDELNQPGNVLISNLRFYLNNTRFAKTGFLLEKEVL